MPHFQEYYSIIDDIADHIRADFIGPIAEDECLEIEDPLNRYSTGILWAQPRDRSKAPAPDRNTLGELFEETSAETDEPENLSIFKPSAMGISFAAFPGDTLKIRFSYAVYLYTEEEHEEDETVIKQKVYQREPRSFETEITIPSECTQQCISETDAKIAIYLHTRRRNENGSILSTVSVLNMQKASNDYLEQNKKALFQCELSVVSEMGFQPVFQKRSHVSFAEQMNEMLYDAENNFVIGHGCAALSLEEDGNIKTVRSDFIPIYRMPQMMPRLLDHADYLQMQYWKGVDRSEALNRLSGMIAQYQAWYETQKQNQGFIGKYAEAARHSFRMIGQCMERLRNGISVLRTDDDAWKAFCYMNEAMLLQRVHTKRCAPETVRWYPFQMAFILQIIPDLISGEAPFRRDVDLLWFPSGGGKTEAYLGLSAFAILYRRLHGDPNMINGVTIIMRYTLRLLTIQQFERASALICALETMRTREQIPGGEISIGLWIGSGMTPNHLKDAEQTLLRLREDVTAPIYEANPMQIVKCPWCGTEIGIGGYEIRHESLNIRCENNPKCAFYSHLPIYIIDDDIYSKAPTFVLSTVDKFARITWEADAGNLFGANGCLPPELLIQDELHLISGPLGSITGIYEAAIEEICRHYGHIPKIIASTATVKNADKQIKILYNREMIQFPPNGLSHKDSFFAVEADETQRPARTYLGLCALGSGNSEAMIKLFALLIVLKHLYQKQRIPAEVVDQFYTCVGYFNSLKELGSNANIIMDRVTAEIRYLTTHKFKQECKACGLRTEGTDADISLYYKSDELTSRNSAREIKNILERLSRRYTDQSCYDYIMASNMLSVGIDIDRLGVMCMYGQPKSNSEYIQATSRVGRTNPGLVIALYNGMRSRDKSYFEQFRYYHRTFYKYVESTSVTSYSPRAIEKALHCAMMAIVRQTISRYHPNEGAAAFRRDDPQIEAVKQMLLRRVQDIDPRMRDYAEEWLDYYLKCWRDLVQKLPNTLVFSDYHNEDAALFRSAENQTGSEIPAILNSVRNVESSANIYFTKR